MKLKIRGLVFTGFAAAVFASSAMAEAIVPPSLQSPTPHPDSLKKTVVSQDYTDETFQERATSANGYALTETNGTVTDKAALVGWAYGQNGENKEWVKLEGKMQLSSTTTNGSNADTEYVEIVHDKNGQKHYVQLQSASLATTSGAITSAGVESGTGDTITDLEKNRLTTAKAVYDFVMDGAGSGTGLYQPKATSTTGAQVGVKITGTNGDPDTSTWYTLGAGQNGVVLNTFTDNTPYARVYRDDDTTNGNVAGVYVDLDHSRIVASSAYAGDEYQDGINLTALASSTVGEDGMALVTAGAVYDLLDREGTGNTTTIGSGSTDSKVPTSKNVYDYAVKQNWGSTYANKTLVTDDNGVVTVSDIPVMPGFGAVGTDQCRTSGKHCALVTNADSQGNVTFEWVVMAGN